MRLSVAACSAALLTVTACAPAQAPAAESARVGPYQAHDALTYHITLDVDMERKHLEGVVGYTFRADEPLTHVALDAMRGPDWSVSFEDEDAEPLEAVWSGDSVQVELGEPVAAGEEFRFRARLRGTPPDGFYFARNRYGAEMAFTDHYSVRARGWLPCEDHPADRARFHVVLSFPAEMTAVASGDRPEGGPVYDPLPERRIEVTETRLDIPPYMLAIAVGSWASVAEEGDPRLRDHLVYPRDANKAKPALVHHAAWIRAMEEAIGDYPWSKYMVFQCPTRWGGFEAPGNVLVSEQLFDHPFGVNTLAHELVHMWFGDGIGYALWHEVWLSEGFATYLGPWLYSQTGGPSLTVAMTRARARWLDSDEGRTLPILWDGFERTDEIINANAYQKGAWVLHMLRGELGDEAFFGALRDYWGSYRGVAVVTADFIRSVEASTGRDLGWFFEQWLERPGCPELRVQASGGSVVVEQVQEGPPFRFRLPLGWRDADGDAVKRVFEVSDRRHEFPLDDGSSGLSVDPDVELLFRRAR